MYVGVCACIYFVVCVYGEGFYSRGQVDVWEVGYLDSYKCVFFVFL